ncbi:ABC transporter permease [Candidatus Phycosocius spiralis]|uniref:Transport permease protein n=1 Tax=Candidatus Phycosocius spiralis TaxID=2815099 RepID=A0ABQ4PWQ7_9PROT|nr:ABC transporter permease [Candidatus Phycosocius spiralis]GIU67089.1 transport permease protein [Candidatus Phycosocius spiralis]
MKHTANPQAPRTYGAVNWIGLQTLYLREVRRFWKVAVQTIFGPVVSTWLLMVVFVMAFGADKRVMSGIPFADFLAPGLIMLSIIQNAFANSSSSLIVAKVQNTAVDFIMPPLSAEELTVGFIAGATTRGLLVALAMAISIMLFANVLPKHLGWTIYFGLVGAIMFGAFGVLGGIWADKFDNLAFVTSFVITPLTFLSGTFYSITVLPEPFHAISMWNPVFHLIDGFRYGLTNHADANVMVSAVSTGTISLVLVVVCWYVFKTGWRTRA